MFQDVRGIELIEEEILDHFAQAIDAGLMDLDGRAAFQAGARLYDRICIMKAEQIYSPLAADPLTRDYVSRLDEQLRGLISRIDVLRAHIELACLSDEFNEAIVQASLQRMTQQLKVLFRREATLLPVHEAWQKRHCPLAAMSQPQVSPKVGVFTEH